MGIPIIGTVLKLLGGGPLISELVKLDAQAQRKVALALLIVGIAVAAAIVAIGAAITVGLFALFF